MFVDGSLLYPSDCWWCMVCIICFVPFLLDTVASYCTVVILNEAVADPHQAAAKCKQSACHSAWSDCLMTWLMSLSISGCPGSVPCQTVTPSRQPPSVSAVVSQGLSWCVLFFGDRFLGCLKLTAPSNAAGSTEKLLQRETQSATCCLCTCASTHGHTCEMILNAYILQN